MNIADLYILKYNVTQKFPSWAFISYKTLYIARPEEEKQNSINPNHSPHGLHPIATTKISVHNVGNTIPLSYSNKHTDKDTPLNTKKGIIKCWISKNMQRNEDSTHHHYRVTKRIKEPYDFNPHNILPSTDMISVHETRLIN